MGSYIDVSVNKNVENMNNIELFTIFEIEFVNESSGQVVNLTTTVSSYKELGKYLTDMGKKRWRMLKTTRKEN